MRYVAQGLAVVALLVVSQAAQAQIPLPQPGPEHKYFEQYLGTWDATVDSQGEESKGVAVFSMLEGGLWMATKYDGSFAGTKFEGRGFDGYDPAKKKYVGVWIDSMTPTAMNVEGTVKDNVLTSVGEGPGPDGQMVKMTMVTKHVDKDTMLFTMYVPGENGANQKLMSITYKRRK